jgi:hypothetical protein
MYSVAAVLYLLSGFSCTGLYEIQTHPLALSEDLYGNFTKWV